MASKLATLGVTDTDAQWGDYAFLRRWDRDHWRRSIAKAETTPLSELNPDGNRAVMFSTTTDPFQVFRHPDGPTGQELRDRANQMIREALEDIRDRTTLNVRILTRSPLARNYFGLFETFGNRLLFGMSIPTLNDRLARIYEPHAPAPYVRLRILAEAKQRGIPIYVAVAPVYPDCDHEDMQRTIEAIAPLRPETVFMEPLNIRADNVERIKKQAAAVGHSAKLDVFDSPEAWAAYSLDAMFNFEAKCWHESIALGRRVHLWPDASLGSARLKPIRDKFMHTCDQWLERNWNRVSEWPGKN